MSELDENSLLIMEHDKVENIRAFVRMRGLNIHELGGKLNGSYSPADAAVTSWKVLNDTTVVQTTNTGEPLPKKEGKTYFNFNKVMGESSSNQEVYEITAQDIVRDFVRGYSGSVFTYGQTGAGKTFTMQGPRSLEEGTVGGGGGILHLAACDIFSNIQEFPDSTFLIRLSVIEIYKEEIRDLLSNENKESTIRNQYDPNEGMMTINCTEKLISDYQTMIETLSLAESRRVVRATGMNNRSSRSHTIFSFILERKNKKENNVFFSKLNLVDLAGSDSVHKVSTKIDSDLDKEGKAINKSLLALSHVITGLGRSKKSFINFRDSNLTRVLQRYLAGRDRVSIICCISPSGMCTEQTRKTLEFGKLAGAVLTRAKLDVINNDRSFILQSINSPFPMDKHVYEIRKSLIDGGDYCERRNNPVSESSSDINDQPAIYTTVTSSKSDDFSSANISKTNYQNDSKSLSGESTESSFSSSEALFLEIQEQWSSYKQENSLQNLSPNYGNQLGINSTEYHDQVDINSTEYHDVRIDELNGESKDDDLILVYTRTDDTNEAIAFDFSKDSDTENNIKRSYFERSESGMEEAVNINSVDSEPTIRASEESNVVNDMKRGKSSIDSKDDNKYSEAAHTIETGDDDLDKESVLETKKKKVLEKEMAALAALSSRKESTSVQNMMRNPSKVDIQGGENDHMQTDIDKNQKNLKIETIQMTRFESDRIMNDNGIEENGNGPESKENQNVLTKRFDGHEKELMEWEQLSESFRFFREKCMNMA